MVKYVRPEPASKAWELAGWTREPRNGHEWKLFKAGKPQPQEQVLKWRTKFKCRKCGGTAFKVHTHGDDRYRSCIVCEPLKRRAYYEKHKAQSLVYSKKAQRKLREMEPVFEEGIAIVPNTWIKVNCSRIVDATHKGHIIVEVYGEPAFAIISLETFRKLK